MSFKDFGIACSVNDANGQGQLGFDTKTCYWSAHIYLKNNKGYHFSSKSYRKVCKWFDKKLKQYDIK